MAAEQEHTLDLPRTRNTLSKLPGPAWVRTMRYPIIVTFLLGASAILALGISMFGFIFGILFMAVVIGIPVVLYSVANLKFGIIVLLLLSYWIGLGKFLSDDIKLGVLLDVFLLVMFIGMLVDKYRNNDFKIAGNPISYVVWIWIIYNILEFGNPMASKEAWIYVIRGFALLMIFFFIGLRAMDNLKFVQVFINTWIIMTLISAIYGLWQEFHGMSEAELAWVAADDFRFNLIVNWGRYRIFSIFSDPTLMGILMAYTGLFCIALLPGQFKLWYKAFLSISAVIMLLAMVYAGTRTAYAMIPAGLMFFAMLTLQKRTLMICGILGALGAGIVFSDIRSLGPFLTQNSLERIRSAFKPSEDPSFQVRERSQAFIKPFIQQHPIGGGLGSIGAWGRRFSPGSPLSAFAPDSGYVRVAVELGWLGLLVYCAFFAVIIITGVYNYYRMQDPLLKTYMAALLAAVFSIIIANYPQEALIQVPTVLIFYMIMAMIVNLKKLDEKKLEEKKYKEPKK